MVLEYIIVGVVILAFSGFIIYKVVTNKSPASTGSGGGKIDDGKPKNQE